MKFTLEIELGNDAMKDPVDIADALEKVAGRVRQTSRARAIDGNVRDENGNTVGQFRVTETPREAAGL